MSRTSYLSEAQVAALLADFEAKHDPFGIVVGGISPWQLLRANLASKLRRLPYEKVKLTGSERRKALLRGFFFWRLLRLRGASYLVNSFYSGLRKEVKGCFVDVWFDDLLELVPGGKKVLRQNAVGYLSHTRHEARPHTYDATVFYPLAGLLCRLFPCNVNHEAWPQLAHLANELIGEEVHTAKSVARVYAHFYWLSRVTKIFLWMSGARSCLTVGTSEYALMHACRSRGIRCMELQHGILGANHPYIIPVLETRNQDTLVMPTHILLYGKYWQEQLKDTLQGRQGLLHVVGHAELERYRQLRRVERNKIVVTTQGVDRVRLISFLLEFLRISHLDFELVLKLHPAYDPSPAPYTAELKDHRVSVVRGKDEPNTLLLLSQASLHVSIASACHYDALALGTPTAVLALVGHELMRPLLSKGYATLLPTPEAFHQLVSELLQGRVTVQADASDFCQQGFQRAMIDLLT